MSNNNLEKQQKEKRIEVLVRYTEFLTARPGKCKVYEYKFNIIDYYLAGCTTFPHLPAPVEHL